MYRARQHFSLSFPRAKQQRWRLFSFRMHGPKPSPPCTLDRFALLLLLRSYLRVWQRFRFDTTPPLLLLRGQKTKESVVACNSKERRSIVTTAAERPQAARRTNSRCNHDNTVNMTPSKPSHRQASLIPPPFCQDKGQFPGIRCAIAELPPT